MKKQLIGLTLAVFLALSLVLTAGWIVSGCTGKLPAEATYVATPTP